MTCLIPEISSKVFNDYYKNIYIIFDSSLHRHRTTLYTNLEWSPFYHILYQIGIKYGIFAHRFAGVYENCTFSTRKYVNNVKILIMDDEC